jgi:hypothetical protein
MSIRTCYAKYITNYAIISIYMLITSACSGGSPAIEGPVSSIRQVRPYFVSTSDYSYSGSTFTFDAPFTVALAVECNRDSILDVQHAEDYVTKIEIDFDDGSGWSDITADRTNWKWSTVLSAANNWTQHTYTTAGNYTPTVRVTYWDNEIIPQISGTQVQIVVLPSDT